MAKLRSVKIKHISDYDADTSCLGEYTDDGDDYNICRHCGEYVIDAERYDRLCDLIQGDIYEIGNEEMSDKKFDILDAAFNTVLNKFEGLRHDCQHDSRHYNYFTPFAGGETPGTKDFFKYGMQDFKRMEGLTRGDWYFIGIVAEAVVEYETNAYGMPVSYRLETFTSSGLWGVESDAGDYLDEVEKDELADLKRHLEEFNVDLSDWDNLTEEVERVDG